MQFGADADDQEQDVGFSLVGCCMKRGRSSASRLDEGVEAAAGRRRPVVGDGQMLFFARGFHHHAVGRLYLEVGGSQPRPPGRSGGSGRRRGSLQRVTRWSCSLIVVATHGVSPVGDSVSAAAMRLAFSASKAMVFAVIADTIPLSGCGYIQLVDCGLPLVIRQFAELHFWRTEPVLVMERWPE